MQQLTASCRAAQQFVVLVFSCQSVCWMAQCRLIQMTSLLCSALLCCAMPFCAIPCCAMSMCRATPCHAQQPNKERPWRRYDQDAASTATRWVPASAAPLHLLTSSGASYRLDVELGRLEFEVHPYMALEQQLVRGAAQSAGHSLGNKNSGCLHQLHALEQLPKCRCL